MTTELKPIRTKTDYKAALAEVERLWGTKSGTPKGDRLDVLAARVAEVMNRKRSLSIDMIRRLHQHLGISADVLIRPARENAAA